MTRIGKIARLPQDVREELNRRLRDGEPGRRLIAWLNGHPEVKRVLAEYFGGREINEVNLWDWKRGGYGDWVAGEDLLEKAEELSGHTRELAAASNGKMLDHLATILAVRYGELLADWDGEVTVAFQRKLRALLPLGANIMALRRTDHGGLLLTLKGARNQLKEAHEMMPQAGKKSPGGEELKAT